MFLLCLALPDVPAREIVFASYNVQNYAPILELGRARPGKTAESAEAVVQILKEIRPDILGLCEMGSPRQFEAFRKRLAEVGLDYPEWEYVEAADSERHLALLSRLPIASRQSATEVPFDANGTRAKVRRGFLDVTLQVGKNGGLRILGAHLKSKLASREDEELLRRNEAHLLRRRAEAVLEENPGAFLLVYGDFNDTKDQPVLREVTGLRGDSTALTPLPLADAQGDRWTHYWKEGDVYSRIDFIFVSRALSPRVSRSRSHVHRSPEWAKASDHRPLVAVMEIP